MQRWRLRPTVLARILLERGVAQADLAKETGIAKGTINAYVLGRRKPSIGNAAKIGRALGLPIETVFVDGGDEHTAAS